MAILNGDHQLLEVINRLHLGSLLHSLVKVLLDSDPLQQLLARLNLVHRIQCGQLLLHHMVILRLQLTCLGLHRWDRIIKAIDLLDQLPWVATEISKIKSLQ